MVQVHQAVDRTYGSPRMQRELVGQGFACGRHRIARLMRTHGIRAKQARRFRVTTDSRHGWAIAPNRLGRRFTVTEPNRVWMSDVTYLPTAGGWCYLAVVMDAYARRVIGWALDTQITAMLTLAALEQAVTARRPRAPVLHHSDRGIQYACAAYRAALARYGMEASMSRRGNCWDNAVVESFFASLKTERTAEKRYATVEEAEADVRDYIERFYNRQRRHSTLGHLSPAIFEMHQVA
jgi:putative transposase